MKDLIDRQAAIEAIRELESGEDFNFNNGLICAMNNVAELPSAEPESRREWYMKGYRDAQDAALHESCTDCPLYDHDRHRCPRFNKVIPTTIQEIMDTQTQRWIPVTERMPEARQSVILSTENWTGEGCYWETTEYHVIWKGYRWKATFWDDEVTAWMPLPEPYKEEETHD